MPDLGLTHIALPCTDPDRTIAFYRRYADLSVVHSREHDGRRVFWLSDLRRPFAVVFIEVAAPGAPLGPMAHLGVCLSSRAEVDRLLADARREGLSVEGPTDSGPPVGYWALIHDPDGHTLELSHGQQVEFSIASAKAIPRP